jgi:hypothetical protein
MTIVLGNKPVYDSDKFTDIPTSFKVTLQEIIEKIVHGSIFVQWCDENEKTDRVPDYTRLFMSFNINDGMLLETYKILMFHEVILEIASEIYSKELLGFELSNIFLLLYNKEFQKLSKKFENDYKKFKLNCVSPHKQKTD